MRLGTTRVLRSFLAAVALAVALAPLAGRAAIVNYAWSAVGNPGNAADPATPGAYGAVNYNYNIGTYDVTLGQYTAFLNAVAATDPYGAYDSNMTTDFSTQGITRSGSLGSYTYATFGNANMPVFNVNWGDAARMANWMQNGQPTNLGEATGSTETGAYTLNGATSAAALMAITRNANATIFIPSENEWYKAAYYNAAANNGTYWLYPTQSNTPPSNVLSALGTNNANYDNGGYTDPVNYLTQVGAFADSPGPYGTYDMGGDVWQWNEADLAGSFRGLRGGSFKGNSGNLSSSTRNYGSPTFESSNVGFRLASLPEPGSIVLAVIGAGGVLILRTRKRGRESNRRNDSRPL